MEPFDVERARAVAVVLLGLLALGVGCLGVVTAFRRWRYASVVVALTFGLCSWAGALAWVRGKALKEQAESLAGLPGWRGSLPIDTERSRLGIYASARRPVDYGFRWVLLPLGLGTLAALLLARNRTPAWGWALVVLTAAPATIAAEVNRRERSAPLPSSKYTFLNDPDSVDVQRSIEDVDRSGYRACVRLQSALGRFGPAAEWPRRFERLPHPDVGDWKGASRRCIASFLATRDFSNSPISAGLSLPKLLDSPLLQDDAQRTALQSRH